MAYSDPSLAERIISRVERIPIAGCWIWLGTVAEKTGYGQLSVACKTTSAHRASYAAFKGEIGDKHVCHRCDVRCCVNPEHLFLGTQLENFTDMKLKNRAAFGMRNGMAKLTVEDVIEIRGSKLTQRALAKLYGMGQTQIHRIRSYEARLKG